MAIKTTKVKNVKDPIFFRESKLAHEYCKGQGIEIGAAAHNSFRLPGSVNVAPADGEDFYREQQVGLCGEYAEIDHFTEADKLVFAENESQDYVISSHVFEHLPSPIHALKEWHRVLKVGGIVFMIVPKRDAHPKDVGRELSTLDEIRQAYDENWTVDTISEERTAASHGKRGHYWVFSLATLLELAKVVRNDYGLNFTIEASEETDSKVSNGHTLVLRKLEPVHSRELVEVEAVEVDEDGNDNISVEELDAEIAEALAKSEVKTTPAPTPKKTPARKSKK